MQKLTLPELEVVGSGFLWQPAPNDLKAEQRLLASIVNDAAFLSRPELSLSPDDFYDPLHAEIFRQATLLNCSGKQVTASALSSLFEHASPISQGLTVPDYIKSLAQSTAASESFLADARSVLDLAIQRRKMTGVPARPPLRGTNTIRISLVTPLYRSAPYLTELYDRAVTTIRKLTPDYEIILVNDGSPDDDLSIAKSLADSDPRVRVVDLSRNFGQHAATLAGLRQATGDYVFVCDSDLEEEPEWLLEFFTKLQSTQADVVYGVMTNKNKNLPYRCLRAVYYGLMRGVSGIEFPTNVVPARVMTRRYLDALLSYPEHEVFLLGLWHSPGFKQVPHGIVKKTNSPSTYTFTKLAGLFVNGILSFSTRPLAAVAVIGLLTSIAAFVLTSVLVFQSLVVGQTVPGWASIVTAMLLVGGLTISLNGVIALYVGKIFLEVKRRPVSIIREVYKGLQGAREAHSMVTPDVHLDYNESNRESFAPNINPISRTRLRVGAVCSENASAIQAAYGLFRDQNVSLSVVTHKPAGIENFCKREDIPFTRIIDPRKEAFSDRAADWLKTQQVDLVILFLDRLLSADFVDRFNTINIHPALLPMFPGMRAVEQALEAGVHFLGATAHRAIAEVDAGPILCQSCYALYPADHELSRMLDISFVQRLALLCNVIDKEIGSGGAISPVTHFAASTGAAIVSPSSLSGASQALIREHVIRRKMRAWL